ncbi:hypothetical protein GOP47_0022665 [Adiantum capillus-veneris]|uniref:Uncharacterized protein n=1 Tax=Adiantum capillus-veneris TaxID=13818 RepID=A0A9D4Z725_ADICA|nr:hypothetical protein GOP47_0022665 [Adiantum capillus-veneris]
MTGKMDQSSLCIASLLAVVLLSGNLHADGATLFSQLTNALTVSVAGTQNSSQVNGTRAGTDELYVTWALSSAAEVDDSTYKTVELRLCFGPPSQIDRAWRKTNDVLSKDKTCLFDIGSPQPYTPADY